MRPEDVFVLWVLGMFAFVVVAILCLIAHRSFVLWRDSKPGRD